MNEIALKNKIISWDLSYRATVAAGIAEFLYIGYLAYDHSPFEHPAARLAASAVTPTAGYLVPIIKSAIRAPYRFAGDIAGSILETAIMTGNRAIEKGKEAGKKISRIMHKKNQSAMNLEERAD